MGNIRAAQGSSDSSRRRHGIDVLYAVVLVVLLMLVSVGNARETSGAPAPDFALKSLSGENLRLSEYRGNVVLLNFWATWCGPCRQEMPLLEDMFQRYERAGFTLLGVNIDDDGEPAADMARTLKISFPVLFDAQKTVSRLYGVQAMPATVLIDREGVIRYVHHGYKPGYEEAYLDQLRGLLRE